MCAVAVAPVYAQKRGKSAPSVSTSAFTPANQRLDGYQQRKTLLEHSLVAHVPFRSVGPSVMSGRVVDLAVNPDRPASFYVAFASGGLWYTESNGATFTPLFQEEAVMTIGDIAVDWRTETLWLGSGENNSSRSSYAGAGIYKSADGGKTWAHAGLAETHHIGRIVLHPENPDVAWVAALGHLYSENEERGVYKTTDGGKTWNKTLFVNPRTGVVDLAIDPSDPNILYAAAWERIRYAWDFVGNGKGSGIYKSTDGGETWALLTKEGAGFPTTDGVGRIGLAIAASNPQTLYAFLDNQDRREKSEADKTNDAPALTKEQLRSMSKEAFLALTDAQIHQYLDANNFPQQYNATDIRKQIETGAVGPEALAYYLDDANSLLFDTPVKGAEFYRSDDGGTTWKKTHEGYVDDLVYSYGYYFGNVRVDPTNPDRLYALGVPVIASEDGGKTWKSLDDENVHADHHALWINPKDPNHLVLGNDGGVNITYDAGKTWLKSNSVPVGQFYTVNVDMATPYNIYGGLQDNGVWYGPSTYQSSTRWQATGQYPYKGLMGGDGMQVEIDTRENALVYTGYQFGNYFRVNKNTGERAYITPKHQLGERPLRFNWQTPIYLSRHNQDVLYMGSHRFHRSLNRGDDFETLSDDLTRGSKTGNVPYGTLTTIHESPRKFGLLYVGSDDGLVHRSQDGGYTWTKIYEDPAAHWVSRVSASAFQEGRVYIALNGYRTDNFEALLYVSEDYGKTWTRLGTTLPHEPINVVKEDPENEQVLYVGTDHGAYVSLDRGKTFMPFAHGLPAVAVHDLVVHLREKELVLGTHGRSFLVANVAHIQQLTTELLAKPLHVFDLSPTRYNERWGAAYSQWGTPNTPKVALPVLLASAGEVTLEVLTDKGLRIFSEKAEGKKGLQYLSYALTVAEEQRTAYEAELAAQDKPYNEGKVRKADNGEHYLHPGRYTVRISANGTTVETVLMVHPPRDRPARKPTKKTP